MPASAIDPAAYPRRSFVYRQLIAAGAAFAPLGDAAVAVDFGDGAAREAAHARNLGLVDLSPLPRVGFKGSGTLKWLGRQGVRGLEADNMAYPQDDGALAARLAPGEVLVLSDPAGRGALCARLEKAWHDAPPALCYPVMRRDANFWFRVTGEHAAAMFAKICAVDLRPGKFPEGAVAQTSAARSSVVLIREDAGPVYAVHVLGDSAAAVYFWDCLVDAMDEFGGRPVGLVALRALGALDAPGA